MAPRVSTGIVSYNTRHLLGRALMSLRQAGAGLTQLETTVVDNASTDGSADLVASEFPEVRLVRSPRNLGFAAGMNLALSQASGSYLLLLNPDAELRPGALEAMQSFMAAHSRVGAVGPRLVYPDGSPQGAAFAFPTLPMVFLDLFPLHGRLLSSRLNGRYSVSDRPHPIGHPLGACILVRKEAWDQVGPLDEQFFMYCEEVDWCLRSRAAGWQIYHVPGATVVHHSAQSTGQNANAMLVELYRSRMKLYRKHYPRLFIWAAAALTRLGMRLQASRLARSARSTTPLEQELVGRLEAYAQIVELCRG